MLSLFFRDDLLFLAKIGLWLVQIANAFLKSNQGQNIHSTTVLHTNKRGTIKFMFHSLSCILNKMKNYLMRISNRTQATQLTKNIS